MTNIIVRIALIGFNTDDQYLYKKNAFGGSQSMMVISPKKKLKMAVLMQLFQLHTNPFPKIDY